ncbi:MAG: PAS domain S-box protein [Methanoregula sp.]|nr:PAS domain S-box protein [Methanoregula sp.]
MKTHNENSGVNILVVEDSRTQAEYLKHILENEGYRVFVAVNGNQALEQIKIEKPAIVLTDIMMPEMDGYALCRAIKQDENIAHIPVILVTQLFDPADLVKGLEAGANNIIIKPFESNHVISRITSTLQSPAYPDSGDASAALEVSLNGSTHLIPASQFRTPAILLSSYDLAIKKNADLQEANERLAVMNENLQQNVDALQRANENILTSLSSANLSGMIEPRALPTDRKTGEHSWMDHAGSDTEGNATEHPSVGLDTKEKEELILKIRESEERYRNVVEDQTEFICRFTPDGIITFVNDAYCRYFGLNKSVCIGSPHKVLLPDEEIQFMKQHLASLTPENPTGTIEHRILLPDGKIRWHFWTDRACFGADGKVTEFQSVGIDTTEKQEHVQKIRESEDRFRMITELSPFPISILDSSGNFQYLNKKFEQLFGYTISDIPTQKEWLSKAFPECTERMNAIYNAKQDLVCTDWGVVKPRLFPVTCKNGTVRQMHFCPITLANGEQFVVYEDLTDKTESDRLRSVLVSIVNSSQDAIIGKSLDGTILSWNKSAERYYGYLAEEVIGKSIEIIIPQELRVHIPLFLQRIRNGEIIDRFDTIRLRKDGSRVGVCLTLSPIRDEEGRIVGISTIAQNIAEREKSEISRMFRQQVLHRR